VLGSDPLAVITGEEDLRPDVQVLLELLDGFDPAVLRRWLRASGPGGRPLDLLLARDFAGFEDALAAFAERGLIVTRRDPGASRRARPR
jgi:hypothetical protein